MEKQRNLRKDFLLLPSLSSNKVTLYLLNFRIWKLWWRKNRLNTKRNFWLKMLREFITFSTKFKKRKDKINKIAWKTVERDSEGKLPSLTFRLFSSFKKNGVKDLPKLFRNCSKYKIFLSLNRPPNNKNCLMKLKMPKMVKTWIN